MSSSMELVQVLELVRHLTHRLRLVFRSRLTRSSRTSPYRRSRFRYESKAAGWKRYRRNNDIRADRCFPPDIASRNKSANGQGRDYRHGGVCARVASLSFGHSGKVAEEGMNNFWRVLTLFFLGAIFVAVMTHAKGFSTAA